MEDKSWAVAIFEFQFAVQVDVTRHSTNPAHLTAHNGNGLTVNHRFKRHIGHFASFSKCRQALATCHAVNDPAFAKLLFRFFQLIGNFGPLDVFAV